MQTAPARPGDSAGDIDTPALVVDLDAFERNLDLMANAVRGAAVALRPHGKAHKCPDIALAQLERGAVGICCQKVGEAEAFVAAGVRDVLVTNEIVGAAKLARLAAIAKTARVGVLADSTNQMINEQGKPAAEDLRKMVPKETKMATFALRWILMHEAVTCVIPGAKRPAQVDENCDAGDLPALTDETMAAVHAVYEKRIKKHVHWYW